MTAQAAPTGRPSPTADLPDAPPRRRYAGWRPRTALLVVLAGLVASQLLAFAVAIAAGGSDGIDWVAASGLVLADAFLIALTVHFARRGAERLGAATFGIRRTAFWPAVGWMALAYVAVSIFNAIWLTLFGTPGGDGATGSPSTAAIVFVIAGVAVAAPIAEEIVFRGYLFPALARWRGPWIGALLGAAVFGAAHCLVYPPQLLPMMAMFGFAACMLFWFTGSLLPGIALHAVNNALVTGIDLGWSWQVPLLMLGCMSLALALLAPFARERAPRPATQ
jgi:membrane protease YdiL (CAAX protease family)